MTRFAVLALLCLAVAAVVTGVSSAATKPQAFHSARGCLLKLGGGGVIQTGAGGVVAFNRPGLHGSSFWSYKTFLGQVSSVTVFFAGQPGLSAATQSRVKICLTAGI
jgi:hypothetical protein